MWTRPGRCDPVPLQPGARGGSGVAFILDIHLRPAKHNALLLL
jgi:hypothetical protein